MNRPEPSGDRAELALALERLPQRPGCYRFRNRAGETIYVGKAKSLRSRVRSYFRPSARHSPHIARMVSEVRGLDVIVVDTELEALILESNLIKRERPRYNVVLRDDKNFPYVKLSTGDDYPRASLVRRARLDGSRYVGPFLPASSARQALKMVQRYFQVATCREVFDGKRRPCLYYHLEQCLAPCAGKTTPEEYGRAVGDVVLFLDGRHRDLEASLDRHMRRASQLREYENAARYRDTLKVVRRLGVRQRMSSVGLEEQDYWADHREAGEVALQLFQMREGRIQARREFTAGEVAMEAPAFLSTALVQYYTDVVPPPDIYVPILPDEHELLQRWLTARRESKVALRVPRRGPKRKLLELVAKNARLAFESKFRAAATHGVEALEALAVALGLDEPPYRIECFDISNLHGTDSVASLVVWEGGRPRKSEYRTFRIREVAGSDDTASIAEAVGRRYRRRLGEGRRMPELILIDGGRGQLGAAVAALTSIGLPLQTVASIAKREELIFIEGRSGPIRLDRSAPALQLIQRIRDEAHRFAVTAHRKRRSKRTLKTDLTEIPGLGPVRARKLLRAFGSIDGVGRASLEELAGVVGPKVAEAVHMRYRS